MSSSPPVAALGLIGQVASRPLLSWVSIPIHAIKHIRAGKKLYTVSLVPTAHHTCEDGS